MLRMTSVLKIVKQDEEIDMMTEFNSIKSWDL